MKISDEELQERLSRADLEYETIKDNAREYDLLRKENNELTKSAIRMNEIVNEKQQEIETLNGVINKLESILYVERKTTRPSDDYNYGVGNTLDYIWYKLQELKGSEKE